MAYNSQLLIFQDDFAENREFIALLVYKNEGRKVYIPSMCILKFIVSFCHLVYCLLQCDH